MNYGQGLIGLIDQRIDHAQVKPTKMGTVVDRESATARVLVAFDGSAGAGQPVKCFENVVVESGDRVGLAKVEGEWIIIGTYTARTLGDSLAGIVLASGSTTTSAVFVDMPTSPSTAVFKARDVTQFHLFVCASMTSTATATVVEIGVNVLMPDGTNFDQALFHRAINVTADHKDMSGGATTPGLTLPGGAYAITGRWRRVSGTGTLAMDSNDSVTIWAQEAVV